MNQTALDDSTDKQKLIEQLKSFEGICYFEEMQENSTEYCYFFFGTQVLVFLEEHIKTIPSEELEFTQLLKFNNDTNLTTLEDLESIYHLNSATKHISTEIHINNLKILDSYFHKHILSKGLNEVHINKEFKI